MTSYAQTSSTSSSTLKEGKGEITVTGTVVDENQEPLIGVIVTVLGTDKKVTTNQSGQFAIPQVKPNQTLEFTFLGMQKVTRKASEKKMKVLMREDAKTLGEVVVTGMQTMDKRLFTGSTTTLDAADVKIDGIADISRSLEGRAAGVSVQNVTGTFGTAPRIQVRGATSIYGSSQPLWIVDGVIQENVVEVNADELTTGNAESLLSSAIAGLNADDIESFQILRDGAATSIYGARAMAGVIVINTKKGKVGKANVNYTGEFTMRLKPIYNNFNIMNSQEQMSVYQE